MTCVLQMHNKNPGSIFGFYSLTNRSGAWLSRGPMYPPIWSLPEVWLAGPLASLERKLIPYSGMSFCSRCHMALPSLLTSWCCLLTQLGNYLFLSCCVILGPSNISELFLCPIHFFMNKTCSLLLKKDFFNFYFFSFCFNFTSSIFYFFSFYSISELNPCELD